MKRFLSVFALFGTWVLLSQPVAASTTSGVIDAVNKYAWSQNVGWLDFGLAAGDVRVTDTGLSGYAWGENIGWLSLSCTNDSSCSSVDYGVLNDGEGRLSGYAWSQNVGWIDFSPANGGVTITATGEFRGYAWGENIGWISFSCSDGSTCSSVNYGVMTDWRPSSGRNCTSWTYSTWGSCANDKQTRTILTSLPEGCQGGNPVLEQSCTSGGVGLTPDMYEPPDPPLGGFSVAINSGEKTTESLNVELTLSGGTASRMSISNFADFHDADQRTMKKSVSWELLGNPGKNTVYVKFFSKNGQSSGIYSASITLIASEEQKADQPQVSSLIASSLQPNAVSSTGNVIQAALSGLRGFVFSRNLSIGSIGDDVRMLQRFLIAQGGSIYPEAKITGYFGEATRRAVVRFQEKFRTEVLLPGGLKRGNGNVGPLTRKKINSIIQGES